MAKIICTSDVETECNLKPKPWSQILGLGYAFFVQGLQSWLLDPRSSLLDHEVQVLGLRSWVLNSGFWAIK